MLDNDKLELAQNDPAAFKEYSKDLLEKEIARICGDDTAKLERFKLLQDQIDQELLEYTDPVERYNAMGTIFLNKIEEFKKALATQTVASEAKQNADILTFPKK